MKYRGLAGPDLAGECATTVPAGMHQARDLTLILGLVFVGVLQDVKDRKTPALNSASNPRIPCLLNR